MKSHTFIRRVTLAGEAQYTIGLDLYFPHDGRTDTFRLSPKTYRMRNDAIDAADAIQENLDASSFDFGDYEEGGWVHEYSVDECGYLIEDGGR